MNQYDCILVVLISLAMLVTGIMTVDGAATCYDSTQPGPCSNPSFLSYAQPLLYATGISIITGLVWVCGQ